MSVRHRVEPMRAVVAPSSRRSFSNQVQAHDSTNCLLGASSSSVRQPTPSSMRPPRSEDPPSYASLIPKDPPSYHSAVRPTVPSGSLQSSSRIPASELCGCSRQHVYPTLAGSPRHAAPVASISSQCFLPPPPSAADTLSSERRPLLADSHYHASYNAVNIATGIRPFRRQSSSSILPFPVTALRSQSEHEESTPLILKLMSLVMLASISWVIIYAIALPCMDATC